MSARLPLLLVPAFTMIALAPAAAQAAAPPFGVGESPLRATDVIPPVDFGDPVDLTDPLAPAGDDAATEPSRLRSRTRLPVSQQVSERERFDLGTPGSALELVASWPANARDAVAAFVKEYGPPDEMTESRVSWRDAGEFAFVTVTNEPTQHRFPVAHEDVVEQSIAYAVAPEQLDDIAAFNGSIVVDRTRGIMSARCASQAHNRALLNLADDIVRGERTVAAARAELARIDKLVRAGKTPLVAQRLQIDSAALASTADPDEPATTAVGR